MSEIPEKCDMEDLVCQMQVLAHLRGIQDVMGSGRFQTEMPELSGLSEKLTDTIQTQERSIEETMRTCGMLDPEETPILEPITKEQNVPDED